MVKIIGQDNLKPLVEEYFARVKILTSFCWGKETGIGTLVPDKVTSLVCFELMEFCTNCRKRWGLPLDFCDFILYTKFYEDLLPANVLINLKRIESTEDSRLL